jgi:hypothetical protein
MPRSPIGDRRERVHCSLFCSTANIELQREEQHQVRFPLYLSSYPGASQNTIATLQASNHNPALSTLRRTCGILTTSPNHRSRPAQLDQTAAQLECAPSTRNTMPSFSNDAPKARQIAQALVDFSVDGAFPEETVGTLAVDSNALPATIEALASAKSKLQVAN